MSATKTRKQTRRYDHSQPYGRIDHLYSPKW